MLRLLHCSEIETSSSEQRNQPTQHHMVLPHTHTQRINKKLSTNSFINILYFN